MRSIPLALAKYYHIAFVLAELLVDGRYSMLNAEIVTKKNSSLNETSRVIKILILVTPETNTG